MAAPGSPNHETGGTCKKKQKKKTKTKKNLSEICGNVIKQHINACKQYTLAQDKSRQKLSVGGSGEEEESGGGGAEEWEEEEEEAGDEEERLLKCFQIRFDAGRVVG